MNSWSAEDTVSGSNTIMKSTGRPAKRRQVPLVHKNRVRRNLFGPVDHERTDDFLQRELAILTDLSNCRWNFDFVNEKPMSGRWSWEIVRPGDRTVPAVYGSLVRVRDDSRVAENVNPRRNPLVPVIASGENRLQDLSSSSSRCGDGKSTGTEHSQKQSSLKGFLSVKKRKSKANVKCSSKIHNRCMRNSRVDSLSSFNQGSSLPNIVSEEEVAESERLSRH